MKALQKPLRRALLARLKAFAPLTSLVPAASIYSQNIPAEPAWPFIRLGSPNSRPFRATCVDGANISIDVHAFARGNSAITGEDFASDIGEQIETTLGDNWLDLGSGIIARIRLSDINLLQDYDTDAFHYLAQVNAKVMSGS